MEAFIKYGIGVVAAIALILSVIAVDMARSIVSPNSNGQSLGATAGGDFYFPVAFLGGKTDSGSVATSSQASTETLGATELRAWANSSVVSYAPGLATVTITLPASSTLAQSFVPKPGDRQSFCIRNATSTSGTIVTFAGALGTKLLVASSSASTVGASNLYTGKIGCFTFLRETSTSTAYDIDALFTAYQ